MTWHTVDWDDKSRFIKRSSKHSSLQRSEINADKMFTAADTNYFQFLIQQSSCTERRHIWIGAKPNPISSKLASSSVQTIRQVSERNHAETRTKCRLCPLKMVKHLLEEYLTCMNGVFNCSTHPTEEQICSKQTRQTQVRVHKCALWPVSFLFAGVRSGILPLPDQNQLLLIFHKTQFSIDSTWLYMALQDRCLRKWYLLCFGNTLYFHMTLINSCHNLHCEMKSHRIRVLCKPLPHKIFNLTKFSNHLSFIEKML